MIVSLIVAVSSNGVIGRDGGLPWHLPEDLRRFKERTLGHSVIMGRRTFESIGRPLPRRRNLVLSRNPAFAANGTEVFADLERALAACAGEAEVFIAGGGRVYAEALPLACRVYLTRVHREVPGDTTFPELGADWTLQEATEHTSKTGLAFREEVWERSDTRPGEADPET